MEQITYFRSGVSWGIILALPIKYGGIKMKTKKVLFLTLNIDSNRTPEENLGIYYLQKALDQNEVKSEFMDCWLEGLDHIQVLKNLNFEEYLFIGITGCLSNVDEIKKILPIVKKGCPIICGGYGATFGYEDLLFAGIDLVMLGEGDLTILEVADYYNGKRELSSVSGIAYMKDNVIKIADNKSIVNLADLPILDNRKYLEFILRNKAAVNILGSKGCIGNCIFCSISSFYKNTKVKWRGRDIDDIIREIGILYRSGARVLKFVDDSFIEMERDETWTEEFAKKINTDAPDILFRISLRADCVTDKIIYNLKKAGLFAVSCGIENGSDSALKRMAKKSNVESNQNALDIFSKYTIYVQAGFILFDDATTMEELWENLLFLKRNKQIITKGIFTEMYAAEGTPYSKKLLNENSSLQKKYGNYIYELKDSKVQKVYVYLKRWHMQLAEFYDKLIDPISAPKALMPNEYKLFYSLYCNVHQVDLNFFENVLRSVDSNSDEEVIFNLIKERSVTLLEDMKKVNKLYDTVNLKYDASYNIFL